MRLKREHIEKISHLTLKNLKEKNLVKLRASEEDVVAKIKKIITDDLVAEVKLEEEAKDLLEQYRDKINAGMLDERQALNMIKKQLAKERKILI